ncbi:glycosyltransferase family protein [Desulfosporosinus sp. FKA]|uniref:cytidylyltransferase domain-containing protein n=1 Tax=Desulfosporosinus sp. FKA TaxID=1969834 RepID=UPI001A9A5F04|nr:glycosyltransferase family protein [Desulfosporosinus sp. FKA]
MKIVCIVQARMGSERLPGKVLMDIAGKPMLEHVLDRLKLAREIDEIVVATSTKPDDDLIARFCDMKGTSVFRGSELDVLSRYYQAAQQHQADIVIRVTADCPLVDFEGIDLLIHELCQKKVDYIAFDGTRLPRGLSGEVFTFEALKLTYETAHQPYEREHVTIHMYEHPEKFQVQKVEPPSWMNRPNYRLTVDTLEDIELIRRIYEMLNHETLNLRKIINLMDENRELLAINSHIKQKNPKE